VKVVLLNTQYAPNVLGGAERVVQTLAETLLSRGHEPVVVCTGATRGVSRECVAGVPVYYVGLRNIYQLLPIESRRSLAKPLWHAMDTANIAMTRALGRILDDERPTVIHTHNLTGFSALAWSAAHDRRIPIVHTLHDYYLLCPRSTMFANGVNCERRHAACAIYSWPRIKLSSRVRAVVGVSRFVLDRHLAHGAFPHAESFVIGNPCALDATETQARDPAADRLRIGYLGRLESAKGVEQLLVAAQELASGAWELHVGGTGTRDAEDGLRARFADRRIVFHGFVDRDEFLRHIDLLVVPSLSNETFGLVAIEAFAAGVPVVASRRGGLGEVVDDGVTGALFEPNCAGELRAILQAFVAEPSRVCRMRGRCLERARDFESDAISAQYESVYERVTHARAADVTARSQFE
jgi:glycosyltransferase involved in cell wall biosynthesis